MSNHCPVDNYCCEDKPAYPLDSDPPPVDGVYPPFEQLRLVL